MQYHTLAGFGLQRIDPEFVIVALCDFQERGVLLLADHVLKDFLTLGLLDGDGITQRTPDIHRHANDLLPGQEGKLQFAFEHPGIGIKENKLKPGDGLVAVHLRVDLDGIQTDGDESRVLEDDSGADDGRHGARWTPISLPERRPGQDAQG